MYITLNPKNQVIQHQAAWPKALDPNPESLSAKVTRVFYNLISIIFIPIGLYRLTSKCFRHLICRMSVPGKLKNLSKNGERLLDKYQGNRLALTSPDGVKIDGAFFPGENRKKAIIYAFGNADQWENLGKNYYNVLEQLKPFGTSILSINPRGVGRSQGICYDEGYELDLYTAYDFLIKEEQIDPNNILFIGQSMGAAYGTRAAALIQEEYPDKEIKAINIRSFSSLQKEVEELFPKSGVFGFIVQKILKFVGFNMDVTEAWKKLKGTKALFYVPSDTMIPFNASLFKSLVEETEMSKTTAYEMIEDEPKYQKYSHNRPFYLGERIAFHHLIASALDIDLNTN